MGNCIRKEPSTRWGGDDWGSFGSDRKLIGNSGRNYYDGGGYAESESRSNNLSTGLPTGTHEVKIKISKKQLEKLLKKAEFQGVSGEQVLVQLMSDGGDWSEEAHRRAWRPELQSIPE